MVQLVQIGKLMTGGRAAAPAILRAVPTGFGWTPSFSIYKRSSTFTTNFDIDAAKPAYASTVYVGSGGNNSNDGLSYANRVRSLKQAIVKANAIGGTVRLLVDPGDYFKSSSDGSINDNWDGQSQGTTVSLVIEPSSLGRIRSIQDVAVPAYASTGQTGIYVSTYTTQTVSRSIIDLAFQGSSRGEPTLLYPLLAAQVSNASAPWPEMNAMWTAKGSASFIDTSAKKIYVRRPDNSAPDSNVRVLTSGNNGQWATGSNTLWMDSVSFYGGVPLNVAASASGNLPKLYGKSVEYCFAGASAADGGITWKAGGEVYHSGSYAAWNGLDGFNYHKTGQVDAISPNVLEINCVGDWNGWLAGGANNGSTCHETTIAIRVNGLYRNNADRSIHDINTVNSWNLGCVSGPSYNADGYNYGCGRAGQTDATRMWLDTCQSVHTGPATNYDLGYFPSAVINYANMDVSGFTNLTGGTLSSYTP